MTMNTIAALHHQKEIQAHQHRAAVWLGTLSANDYVFSKIRMACRDIDTRPHKSARPQKIDPFKLLIQVCNIREKIQLGEIHIGILREALNIVNRVMISEKRGDLNYGGQ